METVVGAAVEVKVPSKGTLAKYGLTEEMWRGILLLQGSSCYCCRKVPKTGRLCIDHFHAKGWKKMPPEKRRLHVRGLLCWRCNASHLGRGVTIQILENGARYLREHDAAPVVTRI